MAKNPILNSPLTVHYYHKRGKNLQFPTNYQKSLIDEIGYEFFNVLIQTDLLSFTIGFAAMVYKS